MKKNPSDGTVVGGILFCSSLERHEAFWLFTFIGIAFLQFLAVGIDEEQFAFSVFLLALDLRIEFFSLLIAPEVRPCSEKCELPNQSAPFGLDFLDFHS
ncbi:hypothetical protein, partial [uncultured Selenomonas sp.]|uniref:hypothetical protein n=1 Tax=uncultured Selenomonas sp. TaxID=159275 RepID=UPI0025D6FB1E